VRVLTAAVAAAALVGGLLPANRADLAPASSSRARVSPDSVSVTTVMSGLDHPWDVAFTPDGAMLVTERPGRLWVRLANGTTRQLSADFSDLWVSGETGLLSVEVDPQFSSNRRFYTCQGTSDGGNTVQVVAWTVNAQYTLATRASDPLVGGIEGSSGRHGGCQLRVDPSGALWIGTGDAATGPYPQDLTSLNGKTLRLDRFTGAGLADNPFAGNANANTRRIYTYGHRNVQGLTTRPGTGQMFSVEHGPVCDDEVNLLQAGGNYGWDPSDPGGPPYNEAVPMTDLVEFPNARPASWSAGCPTIAPSGATFLSGGIWGEWEGALAVSVLRDTHLRLMFFTAAGQLAGQLVPSELNGRFGRLRGAEIGPGGVLYLTTDNGGTDRVLAVTPAEIGRGFGTVASGAVVESTRRGDDNQVLHRMWTGSAWTAWTGLDGVTTADPDASTWGGGRLDVFVRGVDDAVWHRAREGGGWGPWTTLGGRLTSAPTAVSWSPGRVDVFGRGVDGALWSRYWTPGTGWVPWHSLGGFLTSDPEVTSWAPDRLDVFARGLDGAVWHLAFGGGLWHPWRSLGGLATSAPAAVSWGPGRLDVFARGNDGQLWSTYWAGAWSPWHPLGGVLASSPDAASRGFDRLDLFARGVDAGVYQKSWTGSHWTPWLLLQ
jgi:glucose/arabinose dehydrogenase